VGSQWGRAGQERLIACPWRRRLAGGERRGWEAKHLREIQKSYEYIYPPCACGPRPAQPVTLSLDKRVTPCYRNRVTDDVAQGGRNAIWRKPDWEYDEGVM
jgi:hypothetical protein